jgi:hypothetical protein
MTPHTTYLRAKPDGVITERVAMVQKAGAHNFISFVDILVVGDVQSHRGAVICHVRIILNLFSAQDEIPR